MLLVECVPAPPGGLAVDPCGTVGGVALVPIVRDVSGTALDYSGTGQLFSWVVTLVLVSFVVGLVVGAIMRVIRSA